MGKRELKGQTDEKFNYDGRIYTLRGYKYYFIKFNISISNEKSERILIEFKLKPVLWADHQIDNKPWK